MDTNVLLKMKAEIEADKSQNERLEGQLASQMELLSKFGVKTVDEALALLTTKEEALVKMESDFSKSLQELKDAYKWKTI